MNTQFITQAGASVFARAINNKHTSIAALLYVGSKYGAKLGAIWFPNYKEQFDQTADLVESAAVGYGFIMAGDAGAKTTNSTPPTT